MMTRPGQVSWIGVTAALIALGNPVLPCGAQGHVPKCAKVFNGVRPNEVALSPCETYMAAAGYQDGTDEALGLVIVWDLRTKEEVFRHGSLRPGLKTVSFSPDGKLLVAGRKVWECPSGKEIAELKNVDSVDRLRFSPDGKLIAIATFSREQDIHGILLLDTEKWERKSFLKGPKQIIWTLAFSEKGQLLACGDAAGQLHIWNVKDEKLLTPVAVPAGIGSDVRSVCFSKSGKMLLSGGRDERIRVLDPSNPLEPAIVLRGQDGGIWSVVISADERWVFSSGSELLPFKDFGGDGTVQVWNLSEKKLHAKFKAHSFPVLSMALSRDGHTLVTASRDNTVKVWSLPKEFYGHSPKKGASD